MPRLLHELITASASKHPNSTALVHQREHYSYAQLHELVARTAAGLQEIGLDPGERVAVYLPKCPENVAGMFGASMSGLPFVPINPLLKPAQVQHILSDCDVSLLLTAKSRAISLKDVLPKCKALRFVVTTDDAITDDTFAGNHLLWQDLLSSPTPKQTSTIDADVAAILYTSGSTGKPKGVILSQRNMVDGAKSVAQYLRNVSSDVLLAVLPFSFDYGFSQLSTGFSSGASVVLMDYLLPRDVIRAAEKYQVTGLAGVPPLWNQLANLEWPGAVSESLRYFTNSGGAMPTATLRKLRDALPNSDPYLMYGLTEAFRSTYLNPNLVDTHPDSIGRAIPNAEVSILRPDGTRCAPGEPGELVHRGALVALGYWNDPKKTAERFKVMPRKNGLPLQELAVWSGDTAYEDENGLLYFVSREDEMIKTSGYRVSPTELEELLYESGLITEAIVFGVPDDNLGQTITIVATPPEGSTGDSEALIGVCKSELPTYMVPSLVQWWPELPRNPNGKVDRNKITNDFLKNLAQN